MNATVEIIDSSQTTVLAGFDCAGETVDDTVHFHVGVLNNFLIIASKSLTGKKSGDAFFEKTNHAEVVARSKDVYAGKPKDVPNVNYFNKSYAIRIRNAHKVSVPSSSQQREK